MLNFVRMEFFKLKNSKIFLLSLLASITPALLVHLGLSGRLDYGEPITFALLSSQTNLYMLCIFGVLLITIAVAYLFSREFSEHTIKSVLPTPISRAKYLLGKSVAFLIWILILCTVCFIASLLLSYITGTVGISVDLILKYFSEMIFGGFLLFLVMSPLIFISMLMKNMVPAMIAAAILTFGNIIAYGHSQAIYWPWTLPAIASAGEIANYTTDPFIVFFIISATFIVGLSLSYLYLTKKDLRL
ncbi:ABC transporter permease [Methanobrevibacter sp.]|uniref:ABC transporter permease n=1 Tax=Methanobrevibacter sp. TaxID=66852 RepID=UPI0026DEE1E8|nr:ABC transporter permease [Methanobrevibacter sp.]MDO5823787.1 ABC transporter permease [Methanobrevibacter sp.]